VSRFGNRTRTRGTRFGNTAGLPVPVVISSTANTSLSDADLTAILAINERASQQAGRGAEAIQGGHRYPGEAVATAHAYDEA
jgi:hypothetical protein